MASFEPAVQFVLNNEKGLSKIKSDPGGLTNHGISLRFLKSLSFEDRKKYGIFDLEVDEDTIRNLTLEQAKNIYLGEFWIRAPFEKIINQEHCNYIFDMAVNMGINPAIKCVQRACWAVMKKWELLKDDGILGDKTLAAIQKCGIFIMPPMRAERGNFYRGLIEAHPEKRDCQDGWFNRTYNT